jgi:predicted phage-related endonuclease
MIKDIREIVEFIHSVMLGLETFDNYPTHLLAKYSKTKILEPLTKVDDKDKAIFENLVTIKEQIKQLELQKKELEEHIKGKFDTGIYTDGVIEVKISEYNKTTGIDVDTLVMDYPNVPIDKYKKPDTKYRAINTKFVKTKTTS